MFAILRSIPSVLHTDGMENLRSGILELIDSYLAATGMSARRLGIQAVGSEHFVRRLRSGTSIQLGTVERAISWMLDHPPGDAAGE